VNCVEWRAWVMGRACGRSKNMARRKIFRVSKRGGNNNFTKIEGTLCNARSAACR